MLAGESLKDILVDCGVTHVVWIPDSSTGAWDAALSSTNALTLIRVCREGEAVAVAAGLLLGGKKPVVIIQCTGLFEAGDSLRNFVHDFGLPIFVLVGLRNYYAYRQGRSRDSAPRFAESIVQAWQIPYIILEDTSLKDDLAAIYTRSVKEKRPQVVFLAE
jgi:sulfopyruvate decarboxylase TPP-binding subunit